MREIDIFTLPVYRIAREKYYAQKTEYIENLMFGGLDGDMKREYAITNPRWRDMYETHGAKKYGGPWEYNEIIGFIELYICGRQIRGRFWKDDKTKHVRTRRKLFNYITHKLVPEMNIPKESSSLQIYQVIVGYVEKIKMELKNRYVDDRQLLLVGRYVGWSELIGNA